MSNITLNASMRSNLLSLKNIATQMDKTQLILATGKKVNSAIDNASSYYQARSLTNRAADLTALLDSMGQGIQTIEAATQGLTSGAEFLEQASAVAMEAASITAVPDKEWFIKQVGENGAVVSTAQELRDAVAAGKETICVYGAIDLGDISTSGGLELKANQKLVGIGYFGNYDTNVDKFSSITATASTSKNVINITQGNCVISDLSINYENSLPKGTVIAIAVSGSAAFAKLCNLDMLVDYSDDMSNNNNRAAIYTSSGATSVIDGNMNIEISGKCGFGIYAYNSGNYNVSNDAKVNIKTFGVFGLGVLIEDNSSADFGKSSEVKIECYGVLADGLYTNNASRLNIAGKLQVFTNDVSTSGIYISNTSKNNVNIASSAEIYFNTTNQAIVNLADGGKGANILDIEAGVKIAFEKEGNVKWYRVKADYHDENTSGTNHYITFDNVETILNVENTTAWGLPEIIAEMAENTNGDLSEYSASYQKILDEYDNLIMDASYQGLNLLNGALKEITVNENRSNKYKVEGKDMSAENIGLSRDKWETLDDVTKAMNELTNAINSIRSFQEELGNHYSIITTRINFTEGLTDILETGADDLTLADMNEASAQYLSLQTRQQLAINSLSLASMSARSILSLFY